MGILKETNKDVFHALYDLHHQLSFLYPGQSKYSWRMHHLNYGKHRINNDTFEQVVTLLVQSGFVEYHAGQGFYRPTELGISRMNQL